MPGIAYCLQDAEIAPLYMTIGLSIHSGRAAGHLLFHLGESDHSRVARRCHSQGTVGSPVFDGFCSVAMGHQTVDQSGSEGVGP